MKVKFLVGEGDDIENQEWFDLYIDENEIKGFYTTIEEDGLELSVNIMFNGQHYTIKQEKEILSFLSEKFNI